MATHLQWISSSPSQTRDLGYWLGQNAAPGLVLALVGDLGAGKTSLVQGLARGLGVPSHVPVTSPTFSLVNPYEGRVPFYHLDLYRLEGIEALDALGFRDLLGPDAITAVEWAERFPEALPRSFLRVEMKQLSVRRRSVTITAVGDHGLATLLDRMAERFAPKRGAGTTCVPPETGEHDKER